MATDLKSVMSEDWGYDLLIAKGDNGDGQLSAPIKIDARNLSEIKEAVFFTIQGLQRGLSKIYKAESASLTGVIWRIVTPLKYSEEFDLFYVTIKRKVLTEQEIISESVSYYFDAPNYKVEKSFNPNFDFGPELKIDNLKLPFEIASLQYQPEESIDYSLKYGKPSLGIGLAYSALGIEATVYSYPAQTEVTDNSLKLEFQRASEDIEAIAKENIKAWPDPPYEQNILKRYWMLGAEAERATALWLLAIEDNFIKIRMTWQRDREIDKLATRFPHELTKKLNSVR